jgi:hypothetical protein
MPMIVAKDVSESSRPSPAMASARAVESGDGCTRDAALAATFALPLRVLQKLNMLPP